MGSPGRLALRAWPGGPWFMVGLQPPLSSFVFPPQRTLVLPLKGCAPLSFPSELSPPVSWNGPMFVFLVPLNRPKEERTARFCVTDTPGRSGPGGAGRPHAPARGCWSRGEIGPRRRVHAATRAAVPSPKNAGRPRWRPGRASQAGRAEGAACRTSAGRVVRRQPPPAARGKELAWSLFFPLTPQPGPAAAADLWQDFCSGRERGKKAIDFNRISPQTLMVCCCYASIWRSLFINERVRSVAKTLRARICVIKLKAG